MTDVDKSRHDLRNQLAIIRGFAEMLLEEVPAETPVRRDIEQIHKAAVTALELLASVFPADRDTSHSSPASQPTTR
jgi:signal transduction histidine kinase